MKRRISVFAIIALPFVAMLTMSFVNHDNLTVEIPDALEAKVIDIAKGNGLITSGEAAALEETDAMQRCVDAFVASGFEPSAAVDELARISVEKGYFSNVESAKKAMRDSAEKARKTESSWTRLYTILGL